MTPRRRFEPVSGPELQALRSALGRILLASEPPVVMPGEAALGIEAIAAGLARPGLRVLNVVSGPYGAQFGRWLARGGAEVTDISSAFDDVIRLERVEAALAGSALAGSEPDVLAFVQAEAATGGSNPAAGLMTLARERGLVTVIDAVSAIGAEILPADEWGADFVAIGAQKALAGPNGVSAVAVSERGWALLEANAAAPRRSILSLIDAKRACDAAISGGAPWAAVPSLEARALLDSLAEVEREGLPALRLRHELSRAAILAALETLGLSPWQRDPAARSPLVTTVRLPVGASLDQAVGLVAPGDGDLRGRLARVNHYGAGADLECLSEAVATLAGLAGMPLEPAISAARRAWEEGYAES